jgi:hypothetical protein
MFYKSGVDISNVKSMWEFLHNHFTYSTMNSWNRLTSIANNVKLYNLGLEGDWTVAYKYLIDEADCAGVQMEIEDAIRIFEIENPGYKVYSNGRSGGYLVLCNAENNLSVLPACVTDFYTYEDFKEDCKDTGYRVSDYVLELRETVKVVREFDKLCDYLRDMMNMISKCSFDEAKLLDVLNTFMSRYGDDLSELEIEHPVYEDGKINLRDCSSYNAFMDCLFSCLGSHDRGRAYIKANCLMLREV